MTRTFEDFLGDGDGPAVKAGGGVVVARQAEGRVSVSREGELVALTIGHSVVRFKSDDAVRVGQWLMARGVEAKALRGEAGKRVETR